ncbi:hypothetical protein TNCV_3934021 [Trichonephila clavipes]|nr:hypothetical protein TNCV_3934021 [Trichonephila clavipes]
MSVATTMTLKSAIDHPFLPASSNDRITSTRVCSIQWWKKMEHDASEVLWSPPNVQFPDKERVISQRSLSFTLEYIQDFTLRRLCSKASANL